MKKGYRENVGFSRHKGAWFKGGKRAKKKKCRYEEQMRKLQGEKVRNFRPTIILPSREPKARGETNQV